MKEDNLSRLAVLLLIVLVFLGPLLAFPMVENDLDTEANKVEAYTTTEGAELKWQGRNGYLTVPDNLEETQALNIVKEIESIKGVRRVEIIGWEN